MNAPNYKSSHIQLIQSDKALEEPVNVTRVSEFSQNSKTGKLLWEIVESQNARFAQQIHQNVANLLATLINGLQVKEKELQDQELIASVYEVLDDIRSVSRMLYPQMLSDLGLKPALQWLVRQMVDDAGIQVTLNYQDYDKVDDELALVLFRVCQEAISNILKHTDANRIHIQISQENGTHLTIQDNGQGFNLSEALMKKGGLFAMIQRVWNYSGTIYVITEPGEGCCIKVQFK